MSLENEENEENEEYLYIGTIVSLKSGGPLMTVMAVDGDDDEWVICSWFIEGAIFEDSFSIDSLVEHKE